MMTVPDDLTASGWHWGESGRFLHWPYPKDGRAGMAVPVYDSDYETCYATARNLDRLRAEGAARRAAAPPPKPRRGKKGKAEMAQLRQEVLDL